MKRIRIFKRALRKGVIIRNRNVVKRWKWARYRARFTAEN